VVINLFTFFRHCKSPPFHTVVRIHLFSLSYHILVILPSHFSSMEQMLMLLLMSFVWVAACAVQHVIWHAFNSDLIIPKIHASCRLGSRLVKTLSFECARCLLNCVVYHVCAHKLQQLAKNQTKHEKYRFRGTKSNDDREIPACLRTWNAQWRHAHSGRCIARSSGVISKTWWQSATWRLISSYVSYIQWLTRVY